MAEGDARSTVTVAPDRPAHERILILLFDAAVLIGIVAVLWYARHALAPYLLGLFAVYLVLPVVRWLESHMPIVWLGPRFARPVAAITTTAGTIILALILIGVLFKPIVDQTTDVLQNLGIYWETILADNDSAREAYQTIVPEEIRTWINGNSGRIGQALLDGTDAFVAWLFNASGSLVSVGMAIVSVPLFVVYYLIGEPQTAANLKRQLPRGWAAELLALFRIVDRVLGATARGVIIESSVVGVITGLGYWAIGVEVALPLAVIAFAGEIVPIIGPWIAFMVSFPVVLATQPELTIPAIGVFLLIQAVEGWLLAPRIQGGSVEFTPAGTLVILAIGGTLAGALGVVFALPAAAIIRSVLAYASYRMQGHAPDDAVAQLRQFRQELATEKPPPASA